MRDPSLGPPSPCGAGVWVQPEGIRRARPLLLPYELWQQARGWDAGPKVGRGVGVLQNNYLVTHGPVHHPHRRKEERQAQAMPGRADPEGERGHVRETLGGGNFAGSWLTQPHRAGTPCLTLLHPSRSH